MVAMSARTVFHVLEEAVSRHGDSAALHQPEPGRKHRSITWRQYRDAAAEIASGLRSLGIGRGDVVALFSETRAEFYLADLGVMANGSVAAALYTTYPAEDLLRSIANSDATALFVEDPKSLQMLRPAAVRHFILLTGSADGAITLDELRARGREAMTADPDLFPRILAEVSPDDDAVLYLTSGATGEPKMVMVTHRALVANVDMGPKIMDVGPNDRTVAWLPSAHIAQRVVMELLPMRMGVPVWFAESLMKLPQEIRLVKPTLFLAPPRMWERVYTTLSLEIRKRPALVRQLFFGALGLGTEATRYRQEGKPIPAYMAAALKLADALVFRKIRERLGGELRVAISGAAPLGKDLAAFYDAIGLPLIEGYGLTEGGVASFNPIERPKLGSIGKALPGVEFRLAEDGELLLRSPAMFSRYYRDPEATAAVFRDGWLHTGDLASIDDEGYIYITGRKKEMIVSSTGKKVYPARVESLFKVEPLISQVVLVGDRLPYVTALLTLNPAVADSLNGQPGVEAEVKLAVRRVNKQLAPFEQIRKYKILARDFSIEQGELTATMKIRRTRVFENFKSEIEELYAGKEDA
ncbi:MAG: long-chain fatty acid--CoA ligase [Bryobacterales bacterium]|nr:long-chain fatty acid--CoA ligase [Bryobacterales bacterium]